MNRLVPPVCTNAPAEWVAEPQEDKPDTLDVQFLLLLHAPDVYPALCATPSFVDFSAVCDHDSSMTGLAHPEVAELVVSLAVNTLIGTHEMTLPERFRGCLVEKSPEGSISFSIAERKFDELPTGDVTVQVAWSSLNYKDALAATGHPGVTRTFPHIPGIDAAGVVVESSSPEFPLGTEVIATGHELGVERWGGWAEFVRVPAAWLVKRPSGLTLEEAMTIGTAGFTAAQSVLALIHAGVTPERGPILVTGATGGVGSMALQILAQLGYAVTAMSGKPERARWLKQLGAKAVMARETFLQVPNRPLLSATWAGGVDTVGGTTLATLLRSVSHRGCVAACGVVGGADLSLTVYPFILRGITLAGIDSAWCPEVQRAEIWNRLATDWKPKHLADSRTVIALNQVGPAVEQILKGQMAGRTVVRI